MPIAEPGSGVILKLEEGQAQYAEWTTGGNLVHISMVETPTSRDLFVGWLARQVLRTAEIGHGWLVASFPGYVDSKGKTIAPGSRMPTFENTEYDLFRNVAGINPTASTLLKDEKRVRLVAVTHQELFAQAAAARYGGIRVAAVSLDQRRIRTKLMNRDHKYPQIYRPSRQHVDLEQLLLSTKDPLYTIGRALLSITKKLERDPETGALEADEATAQRLGWLALSLVTALSSTHTADKVIIGGEVGSGAQDSYSPYLKNAIAVIRQSGMPEQKRLLADVQIVPRNEAETFSLRGGQAVAWDFAARQSSA